MKTILNKIILRLGLEQISVFVGYIKKSGWLKTLFLKRSIDAKGFPLPWYSYPFIYFLSDRLIQYGNAKKKLRVFEYGSGNSTLWWSNKVLEVVSIEDNQEWFALIRANHPANVVYNLANNESEYINFLTTQIGLFDIIIIDGSFREKCIKSCLSKLSSDGVVIVDNSDWESLSPSIDYLSEHGFQKLGFYGLGPINGHPWETAIFYRNNNIFNI